MPSSGVFYDVQNLSENDGKKTQMVGQSEYRRLKSRRLGCADCYIDLSFDLEWRVIEIIKEFFEEFVRLRTGNGSDVHRIGIAVSELLGNAVKYSSKMRARIIIQDAEFPNVFIVSCENSSDIANIKKLRMRLKEMISQDPLEYYLYRMRESVKDKRVSPGLGLARIYHEAGAEICARFSGKIHLVEVRAIINVN
jgi:hypothetical protein